MKTTKKLFALILAVSLLAGMLAMGVSAEGGAQIVSQQLSLGDDLTMRFQVAVDSQYQSNAVISVAVAGDSVSYNVAEMTANENGNYQVYVDLAAAQMTDAISVQVKDGDSVLTEGSYSIRDYCVYLLEGDYTDATKQMAKEVLNYGAKAQEYFVYNQDNLANAGYELETTATVPTEGYDMTVDGKVSGISLRGSSLVFESKIAIRYYFATSDISAYTFKVGETPYDAQKRETGLYYVEVPGINPQEYAETVSLTVSDGENSLVVGYSPLSYIVRMSSRESTSAELKTFLAALYGYYLEAKDFVGIQQTDPTVFDENNIVISFGALSDIHLTGANDASAQKFQAALTQLKQEAAKHDKDGLDGIGIAGDITDTGSTVQADLFSEFITESGIENVMLTTGNHDNVLHDAAATLAYFAESMGETHFQNDIDTTMFDKGARHCVVNGYHFFFIEPVEYSNECPYDSEVLTWLDNSLEQITSNDPDAYVFLFTHPMLHNTVYGSDVYGMYTTYLTDIVSKYPQVVTLSGHLHFPVNDERSIMQSSFTALGCGSVRYVVFEAGYDDMASASVPKDGHDVSTGLLIQADGNGNLRITKMDFSNESTFKTPWEIQHPTVDGDHLTKYTSDRVNHNQAPILEGTPTLNATVSDDSVQDASVTFPAGSDDDLVHHYIVSIRNALTGQTLCYKFLSDFYSCSQPSDMKSTLTFPVELQENVDYRVEVVAVDSWGAKSEKISCITAFNDPEPTSPAPTNPVSDPAKILTYSLAGEWTNNRLWANGTETGYGPSKSYDGDISTMWNPQAPSGYAGEPGIIYELDQAYDLNMVEFTFAQSYYFKLYASPDGEDYELVANINSYNVNWCYIDGICVLEGLELQDIRFLKIVFTGKVINTSNTWLSVYEVNFFESGEIGLNTDWMLQETSGQPDDGTIIGYEITGEWSNTRIWSDGSEAGSGPSKSFDGDDSTNWNPQANSGYTGEPGIIYKLNGAYNLNKITLTFNDVYYFKLYVSTNGDNYELVADINADNASKAYTDYVCTLEGLELQNILFVKIIFTKRASSNSTWVKLYEVEVTEDGVKGIDTSWMLPQITEPAESNVTIISNAVIGSWNNDRVGTSIGPERTYDGNLTTNWNPAVTGFTTEAAIVYTLDQDYDLTEVILTFGTRKHYIVVSVSTDNETYTEVARITSANAADYYDELVCSIDGITAANTRYIKITFIGTESGTTWINMMEITGKGIPANPT